jgi:uncharacterized protein YndB with AHSA1/START domain
MTTTETTGTSLIVRRTFDAPRERVWRAFTDADELEQWFVPEGMTAEVRANELEAGGEMAISWTDGENHIGNEGYYVDVVENERLVSGGETADGELRLTYEFRDVDEGTEVVITQEFPGPVPDGAAEGWASMLDALAALLRESATAGAEFDPSEYDVTIERTFDAPRERVWAAWTDPEHVAEWWGPEGFTVPDCEMDVRPGGSFSIDMEAPDGTVYPDAGEILEVEEPERLVLVSRALEDEDRTYQLETRNTVTFEADDDRTHLTLKAEVVSATPAVEEALGGMEVGWTGSFEKLENFLEESGGD